ncbi:MAG: methyl-accepting chemotaxis protein [Acetatifactor sp.]
MPKKISIKNLTVRKKITLYSVSMLVLMLVITGFGLFSSNMVNKARTERYNNYAMGEYYMSEAFTDFNNIQVCVRDILFIYYNDSDNLKEQKARIEELENSIAGFLKLFEERLDNFSPEVTSKYKEVKKAMDACSEAAGKYIQMATNAQLKTAQQDLMSTGTKLADSAEEKLSELVALLEEESAGDDARVRRNIIIVRGLLIAVSLLAAVITVFYSLMLIKSITIPVHKMTEAAKKLAVGDVDVDCEKINEDELGDLLDNFAVMVRAVKDQAKIAYKISGGDLTVEVTARSDKDLLGLALSKLVEDNNMTLGNIRESTMQVTVGSEQVASASQALAQGATEQASAIQQVTASMDEIAENTKTNATKANEANSLVTGVKNMAVAGNNQMKDMVAAMNEIGDASEVTSKIIKTIDDIAFQTNILALNAAVEAARAGVHGKGFAVVAEEVRSLAAKSASAAKDTQEKIEDTIHKVDNGMKLAEATAKALDEIAGNIDRVAELVSAIAVASNDQATAISQIDQAIGQVSQVVQTNSATSEQCAAASEELSNQAENLRSLMASFKLASDKGSIASTDSISYNTGYQNEQIISLNGEFGKY